ncbi:hypothetical protein [uncultured Clostridium sp.]|jgi:hypothetical protein|uniref:hypothetical protein n=1 Tax=uncultured Clostridium sp. TaxID=59620 RepID=UPI0026373507|nr:hypothetical protein [uncultured Clostridium sp.]
MNLNDYEDINKNVSMEEFGRFVAINDKKSKVTNMLALRKMSMAGFDYKSNLLELKSFDDEYKRYARKGNCDQILLCEKRVAVVRKIEEIEKVLRSL